MAFALDFIRLDVLKHFTSNGASSRPFRIQSDKYFCYNALGYCSVYCPLKRRMQDITKPTAIQTGATIAESQ